MHIFIEVNFVDDNLYIFVIALSKLTSQIMIYIISNFFYFSMFS